MKPVVTWILVADGAEAKIFEHAGPGKGLRALDALHFEQEPLQAQDLVTDRPGRTYSSVGPGRSAMEVADPVAVRERRFVEQLAEMLERRRAAGDFRRLIIAAAPIALGDLRPALSKAVRDTVIAELPKDLTNLPTPQLESHFADFLPL